MRKIYVDEKRIAFELLVRYREFKVMVFTNYAFEKSWIINYLHENHTLDLKFDTFLLNQNENLKIDWGEMIDLRIGFFNHNGIIMNKTACDALSKTVHKITFSENPVYEKLPPEIKLDNSFGLEDLSKCFTQDIDIFPIYYSQEIWTHFFKDVVDEKMINAWTYLINLDNEVERKLEYENFHKQITHNSYNDNNGLNLNDEDRNEYNNIIDNAFEGDEEYYWNID